jgi:hypothetical protein
MLPSASTGGQVETSSRPDYVVVTPAESLRLGRRSHGRYGDGPTIPGLLLVASARQQGAEMHDTFVTDDGEFPTTGFADEAKPALCWSSTYV